MLKPVSGTGRVSLGKKEFGNNVFMLVQQIKMNKKFGDDVPQVDATLLFDELSFIIDNEQYRDAVLMVDLFHSYLKRQKVNNGRYTERSFINQKCPFSIFIFILEEISLLNLHLWSISSLLERLFYQRFTTGTIVGHGIISESDVTIDFYTLTVILLSNWIELLQSRKNNWMN